MGSSPVIGCMNLGECYLFLRNGFRSQGGDAMLKRIFGLLLKLFAICLGLLAGAILSTWIEFYREGCLLLPYGLVLIFYFGLVFIQFFVLAVVRLGINKIFNLRLGHSTVRYFVIAFLYSAGYGVIGDFIPYGISDNGIVMFVLFPVSFFSAIVAVEILLLYISRNKNIRRT
ncbi:MAG: hypothetical protein ABSH16_02905 [Sedimentisphaerales bacterium]